MIRAAFVAIAALSLASCIESGTVTCQESLACGASHVQTCCTTGHCEYRLGEQVFPCRGTDCTAAAAEVRMLCPDPCADADAGGDGGAVALDASGCVR